jgi:hypothetical protein
MRQTVKKMPFLTTSIKSTMISVFPKLGQDDWTVVITEWVAHQEQWHRRIAEDISNIRDETHHYTLDSCKEIAEQLCKHVKM